MPEAVTRSEFARRLNVSRSYVTKLAQEDRLVFGKNNKILVELSLAKMQDTRDPNRDDVAQRWAKKRGTTFNLPEEKDNDGGDSDAPAFSLSRAKKEYYISLRAKLEYEQQIGKLCETESVRHIAEDLGATLRQSLESLPDQLAPLLAPISEEDRIHALLVEQFEHVLTALADRLSSTMHERVGQK